jgi:peptidoglycan/LPS O-acetylase OafA/YrhL
VSVEPPTAAPRISRAQTRLHYLDGIRATAALAVIVNHCFQQVYGIHPSGNAFFHLAPLLQLGHFSVVIFIVLSGFCLMLPVVRGSGQLPGGAIGFFRKRARRILPAYWAAMAFSLLLIATLIGHKQGRMYDLSVPVTFKGFLTHLFLVNNFGPAPYYKFTGNGEVCSVFWSIALEWQIYFWFPLLVRIWSRWGKWTSTAVVVSLSLLIWSLTRERFGPVLDWAGMNADFYGYFALGMLGASIVFDPTPRLVSWRGWTALTIALFAIVPIAFFRQWPCLDLFCALSGWALLIAASKPGIFSRLFSLPALVHTGEYSYSIYLLHLPILALLTNFLIAPLQPHTHSGICFLLLVAAGLLLILPFSYGFSVLFEDTRRWKWLF